MKDRAGWRVEGTVPPIKAVMTPFPYSIQARASVSEASSLMAEHGIRHLPVQEDHELVGMVTQRDLDRAVDPDASVRDLMSPEVFVVEMDAPLDQVLLHLSSHQLGCALVTKDERLAGIFTSTDVCELLGEKLATLSRRSTAGDERA